MNGREHEISSETEAELAAVADGSLAADRAERVLREAAASPDLTQSLARQRRAVDVVRTLDASAPDALREAIASAAAKAGGGSRSRLRWRLPAMRPLVAAGGGLAVAAAVVLVLVLAGGGASTPTVQQAAPVALRAATAPAPAELPGGRELAVATDGIAFPTWSWVGWHATGQRTDTVGGRTARTVFYATARGGRIGYTIVEGAALPVSGGRDVWARGSHLRLLEVGDAYVVTWHRNGHTCILAARGVAPERLAALASYET